MSAPSGIGRAIAMAIGAAIGFAGMFALLKAAGDRYSPVQFAFFRNLTALLVITPLFLRGGLSMLYTRRPGKHAVRAVAGLLSMGCYFFAVTRMPIADLTAIVFTMPLFLTALSFPLLGEKVGWRRTLAVLVGFAGVLIMLNPIESGMGIGFSLVTGVAIAGSILYALAAVAVRQLGATEASLTTFFYFTLTCSLLSGLALPFFWVTPDLFDWACMIGAGLVGGFGQYCMVDAYRGAPASVVAPFEYTQMIWATAIGFAVWGEVPDMAVILGAVVVAASGLFILYRETVLARSPS